MLDIDPGTTTKAAFARVPGVTEWIGRIQRQLRVLVDGDEDGYLLQIFTKNFVLPALLFFDGTQWKNHTLPFGEGNFSPRSSDPSSAIRRSAATCEVRAPRPRSPASATCRCGATARARRCSPRRSWATRASRATRRSSTTSIRPAGSARSAASGRIERDEWVPEAHVHRLADTVPVEPGGDALSGRRLLMWNADLEVSVCKPTEPLDGFYRNGEGDEVIYVHRGGGVLRHRVRQRRRSASATTW